MKWTCDALARCMCAPEQSWRNGLKVFDKTGGKVLHESFLRQLLEKVLCVHYACVSVTLEKKKVLMGSKSKNVLFCIILISFFFITVFTQPFIIIHDDLFHWQMGSGRSQWCIHASFLLEMLHRSRVSIQNYLFTKTQNTHCRNGVAGLTCAEFFFFFFFLNPTKTEKSPTKH